MSKINDALKRAKNAQRQNPPSGVTPMRPLEEKEERDLSWILPVVIILLIVVAVFFLALSLARHTANSIVTAPDLVSTQQVESVPEPARSPPQLIGPAAIVAAAPDPVRIQGIAYDPVHPWAIVSGKTVYVGDSVNGKVVVAIAKNSVTFAANGQTNKLYVGQ